MNVPVWFLNDIEEKGIKGGVVGKGRQFATYLTRYNLTLPDVCEKMCFS